MKNIDSMIVWENNLVFLNICYFKHEYKKIMLKQQSQPKAIKKQFNLFVLHII